MSWSVVRVAAVVSVLAFVAVAAPPLTARPLPAALAVEAVESIGMTVSDVDRAMAFYTTVLPFKAVARFESSGREHELLTGVFGARTRTVRLALGDERIELTEFVAPKGRPYPPDTRANDRWFQHIAIIVADMDRAYAHLRAHRVTDASTLPQRLPDWNPNAGGIKAHYFRDPDGHFLEILQFPEGKGNPKWRQAAAAAPDAVFLGIDHTAIVTADTEASLRFYRDTLGLRLAGGSVNHGIEQEHLNNVFGARLRITTLAGDAGPAVELLEYLTPGDGRPAPLDLKANDLAHWQTTVAARGLAAVFDLPARTFRFVSPRVTALDPDTGLARGVLVRDPDGHGVRLVERQ
jgi:catechol 2,3-dioxygenase-like lactoylglutathione lyase family enzyme